MTEIQILTRFNDECPVGRGAALEKRVGGNASGVQIPNSSSAEMAEYGLLRGIANPVIELSRSAGSNPALRVGYTPVPVINKAGARDGLPIPLGAVVRIDVV